MPIKTNFLELEKLEGHENYNGDIENSNLDKIDAAVKNNEDRTSVLEDKINKKDQLTVELKPEKRVVSVTDSFGGACGFEIEGALVENIADNITSDVYISEEFVYVGRNSNTRSYIVRCEPNTTYYIKKHDPSNRFRIGIRSSYPVDGNIATNLVVDDNATEIMYNNTTGNTFLIVYVSNNAEEPRITITKTAVNHYIEGLQPLRGATIKAVRKNLIDVRTAVLNHPTVKMYNDGETVTLENTVQVGGSANWVDIPINIEIGKSYYFQNNITQISGGAPWEISLIKSIEPYEVYTQNDGSFVATTNLAYLRLYQYRVGKAITKPILTESSVATPYELHKSTKVVFEDALAKLPNESMDKIVCESGKTVKYVETNVGRDGGFDTPKTEGMWINTVPVGYNHLVIPLTQFPNIAIQTTNLDNNTIVDKFIESQATNIVGTYYTDSSRFILVVDETECPDLETAISLYVDKLKIAYQLATPYTVELSDKTEALNSYDDYTQLSVSDGVVEGELADVGLIGTNYWINTIDPSFDKSPLKFLVNKINKVAFNGRSIKELGVVDTNAPFSHGNERWFILKSVAEANDIDINQIYVDYTTSETNGQVNAKIKYNTDMSSAVSCNANTLSIVGEQVDKNTKNKANKNQQAWIEPTLLNRWKNWDKGYEAKYYKDDMGIVRVTGLIKGGQKEDDTLLFEFPKGYRPKAALTRASVGSNNSSSGLIIKSSGEVRIDYNVSNVWLSLEFSFRAEE